MPPVPWLTQAALHPVYPRLLCAELERQGHSRQAIFEGLTLSWETLHLGNQFVSANDMRALALRGMQLTQCPWLGLEVGFKTQAAAHGVLGAAMMASPNLAHAVVLLKQFARLRQNLADIVIDTGELHTIELVPNTPLGDMAEYLYGQLVAGLLQLFSTLTGRELQAHLQVQWPFARPPWHTQYQRVAANNEFDAPTLRVSIQADIAQAPSLAADPSALAMHLRECELALHRVCAGETLRDRVRVLLENSPQGLGQTLNEVARQLHLTPRTLMRKLAAEHTSFQAIADELRRQKAQWLLANTDTPVDQVALAVGFQDPSNFSRSFKRWCAQTPKAYRQQHRPG